MLNNTELEFYFTETFSCKTIAIIDGSFYNSGMILSEPTIKVLVPGFNVATTLAFIPNTINIYNSNNLGITTGYTPSTYTNLPDGEYVFQYSVCPHEQYYLEKSFYRTCLIECKYQKAILSLNLSNCDSPCVSKENKELLDCVRFYIEGAKANSADCNSKKAGELYNKADELLNLFLNCDDCNSNPCLQC